MKFNIRGQGRDSSPCLNGPQSIPSSSQHKSFLGRNEGPPNQPKDPLLCLTLSTASFLECTILDSATTLPLYRIKTSGTTTTITRIESASSSVVVSFIKWPKIIPMMRTKARSEHVLVHMKDGPWRGGNSLLKPGARDSSPKFRLPNHDNPMKWKLHDDLYWCTTPSVLGAIATLDPRRGNRPPKLTVYEDLHDEHKPHQPIYGGVPILLLDYLVVTALLLVTDLQEWALVPRHSHTNSSPSEQVEFGSTAADSTMWKEEALRPMGTHGLETSNEASSSTATAVQTRPSSLNPPAVQAGSSHVHNLPWLHSFVDTDTDSEYEHVPERRGSLSPLSEAHSPAIESEFFHQLHQQTSLSRRSAVSSGLQSAASDSLRKLLPQSTHGSKRSLSIRSSIIADDIDGEVLPSVLQIIHPYQGTEFEREHHNALQMSGANSSRNPRPLPLPPTAYSPNKSSAGSRPSSLPSQNRSARILPSIPYASHHPHRASELLNDEHPALLDDPSSQFSQHQTITKTSREGITHWLNSLTTGDSPSTENALELLLRASIFDAPPPAYNSLGFPLEQQRSTSSSDPLEEMTSECQR